MTSGNAPILHVNRRTVLAGGAAALGARMTGMTAARPASAQTKPVLQMWTPGGSTAFCKMHEELLQQFAATTSKVSGGKLQCGIGAQDEFTQSLLAGIASGNPPDVTMLWDTPVALGSQGAFLPIDEYMKASRNLAAENWPAGLLKTCQYKDRTYGLPVTAGVYGMWYNQEFFEKKGIPSDRGSFPKTWAELRRLSKEFTRWNGNRLEEAGFMPPREPETLPIWAALNGSQLFDANALSYTINSEQNIEMFEFFVAWLNEEYQGDVNAIDRSGSFRTAYASTDGLPPAFQQGRQAGLEAG